MSIDLQSIAPVSEENEKRLAYIRNGLKQGALTHISRGKHNHGLNCFESEFNADIASSAFTNELLRKQEEQSQDK